MAILDRIPMELDEGNSIDLVYLEFAKAFDKVPHRRLMAKIWGYGIHGDVWRCSWLMGHRERVCCRGGGGVEMGGVL